MLVVNQRIQIPLEEFQFTYARSGGPGGQNVNKVSTKATLHWPVTQSPSLPDDVRQRFVEKYGSRLTKDGQLVLTSQRTRDRVRNVDDCLAKLREMLESVARAPRRRKPTKPTRASRVRRLTEKRVAGEKKKMRRTIRPE